MRTAWLEYRARGGELPEVRSPHFLRLQRDDRRMKFMLPPALALALALAAQSTSFADQRDALAARVAATVGDATNARIQPVIDDARQRLIDAVESVDAHQQTPLQNLNIGQKLALRRARRAHTDPQLDLREDQCVALDGYVRAVTDAALPIIRDDGAKIEALLTRAQHTELDDMRRRARAGAPAPNPGLPNIAAALAGVTLSAGGFVLLVEIDPKALIAALR
jgi:hypothetical protein